MCNRAWIRAWTVSGFLAALTACGNPVVAPPGNTVPLDVASGGDLGKLDAPTADVPPDVAPGTDAAVGADQDTGTSDTGTGQDTATADTAGTDQDTATVPDAAQLDCKSDADCSSGAAVGACKQVSCNAGQCGVKDAADGGSCDDGNACTDKDACAAGSCTGAAKVCDDAKPCTDDSCDVASGCKHDANTATCDDANGCTVEDVCGAGKCSGVVKKCDDGVACTDDSCVSGACENKANTADCSDGNACTDKDKCDGGLCVGGAVKVCDDAKPCTDDSCDVTSGCKNVEVAVGSGCTDGDACTVGDTCAGGKCAGSLQLCDDANPCTKDACDKVAGCQNDNDDAGKCDDGNSCTTKDVCEVGKCVGKEGKICKDDNPCTDDSCANNVCDFKANTAACDDNNACSDGDACAGKACVSGKTLGCDDTNACTTDTCDKASGTCKFENNTSSCDDNDKCTDVSVCAGGVCSGTAKKCDDTKACTVDSCNNLTGLCKFENLSDGAVCDDASACTQKDACAAGACVGEKLVCDDDNLCTDDACAIAQGCTAKNNTAKCDDGSICFTSDACADGACQPGKVVGNCDDKNACTADTCDKVKGCIHTNNTATCNDADACTDSDTCKNGDCDGKPKVCNDGLFCTDDKCDAIKGCVITNNTAPCTDNSLCTQEDKCALGKCVGGTPLKCDDGIACTTNSCDPKLSCQFKAVADKTTCDDGNACTTADVCTTGKCGGVGKSCDDNNICTTDTCAANVCANKANTNPCNDNDVCTQDDKCNASAKCVGLTPLKCFDNEPCTDDKCANLAGGCIFPSNTADCEDGLFCTAKDKCKDSKCLAGVGDACEDANVCTTGICKETFDLCVQLSNTGSPCDDGNKCTSGDSCAAKACVKGKAKCDDDNPCTADSCSALTGICTFALISAPTIGIGLISCKLLPVPLVLPIDANDPMWFGSSTSTSVKWGTDSTPTSVGKLTGAASLNFNNGTNFKDGSDPVSGTATSKFQVDASKVGGSFLTLAFYSFHGVDSGAGTTDQRIVEVSTDGFNTIAKSLKLSNTVGAGIWRLETVELNSLVGKVFQIRFRFDSINGSANDGKGWFVDEANVYAGPTVPVDTSKIYSETFNSNANGWQFSAASAGVQWAIDGTPSTPAAISSPNSLNFNNGINFQGSTAVSGTALSPVIDLEKVTGNVTLLFKEWVDTETSDTVDKRIIEISTDAFTSVVVPVKYVQNFNKASHQKGWRWSDINLNAFKGKKVRIRFSFKSVDNDDNAGKGWFIDDLLVETKPEAVLLDLVTCAAKGNWTIAIESAGPAAAQWAVDNSGIAANSPDCSLNFNRPVAPFGYKCSQSNFFNVDESKVFGTASRIQDLVKPAVGKLFLTFRYFVDVEEIASSRDKLELQIIVPGLPFKTITTFKLPKSTVKQWVTFKQDLSSFYGEDRTVRFSFDSDDCDNNAGAGVAIDDVMIRAE